MFSSILLVADNDERRNRKNYQIETWLQDWCHWQNFGGFDHGLVYMTPGQLATEKDLYSGVSRVQ